MISSKPGSTVLWLQVWGLAAVQGAIALAWVIYVLYFSQFLQKFGFSASVATGIVVLENVLAAVAEPIMGSMSDRVQQWVGNRFPIISLGVILSSALFIAIPALVVFGGDSQGVVRLVLPIVLVAWAIAMTVFRSPALSLLGRYAFETQLPQAASILTLIGAVAGAMSPLANNFILKLGAPVAFTIGSLVLLGTTAVLRMLDSPDKSAALLSHETSDLNSSPKLSVRNLALLFGAGAGVAIGFRQMMLAFPQILQAQGTGTNANLLLGLIFIAIAVTAIPSGTLASRMGNLRTMLLGLIAMAVVMALLPFLRFQFLLGLAAIALGSAFSMVSNGTIPLALSLVPPQKAGLGTGMYFGGGAIGVSLVFSLFTTMPPTLGAGVGAIAFLLTGVCLVLLDKKT